MLVRNFTEISEDGVNADGDAENQVRHRMTVNVHMCTRINPLCERRTLPVLLSVVCLFPSKILVVHPTTNFSRTGGTKSKNTDIATKPIAIFSTHMSVLIVGIPPIHLSVLIRKILIVCARWWATAILRNR